MIAVALVVAAALAAASAAPTAAPSAMPPAARTQPAAAAPPDGTYVYDIAVAGQSSTSTITVKRRADGMHVGDSSNISSRAVTATLVLNAESLAPSSYAATYDVGTAHSQDVSISFSSSAASVTTFGLSTTLPAQPGAPHLVVLDGALPSGFFVLPAAAAAAGVSSLTAINAGALSATVVSLNRALSPPRPPGVPSGDVVVSVLSPTAFSLWYDPKTYVMHELDVPLHYVVEKFVKFAAAAPGRSEVAIARRSEHRPDTRYGAAVSIARHR